MTIFTTTDGNVKCSVIQSIHSKYCNDIGEDRKVLELRKTKPTLSVPFKVLIYCTLGGEKFFSHYGHVGNGKIIGEYVCDRIDEYECEFCEGENECYEDIRLVWDSEDEPGEKEFRIVTSNEEENPDDCSLCRDSCVSFADIKKYVGIGCGKKLYAYHITDVDFYDEPKEISDFYKSNRPSFEKLENTRKLCDFCSKQSKYDFLSNCLNDGCSCYDAYRDYLRENYSINRAPQSWCYAFEL